MSAAHNDSLQRAVQAAVQRGLLPEGARLPADDARPWPVSLLIAFGAWLAAIPLIGVVGILFAPVVHNSAGALAVGTLVIAASVVVLRSKALPVFVEQLAVPGLLVGGGALGFALFDMLPLRAACALLAIVALAIAVAIDRAWLRNLLGVAAAILCVLTLGPTRMFNGFSGSMTALWFALHGALLIWLLAMVGQRHLDTPRAAAWVESVAAGWLLALLAGLAAWSGMTFLIGGSMSGGWMGALVSEMGSRGAPMAGGWRAMQACSVAAGLAAVLLAGRRWPALREPGAAAVGLVLAALSWFLPALGGVLLALAWTATTRRGRLAGAAAVAAAWIVGSFYYQLAWPLAHKAQVLAAAGVALGALAWLARQRRAPASADAAIPTFSSFERRGAALVLCAAVMTLALANFSIWQKESLIATGQKVFVALAPVDPRSLMQGDFMRLNYAIPTVANEAAEHDLKGARPHVIARRDAATGVATLVRAAPAGAPLAEGEMTIELTPIGGRWMLVSDAWFFREGDARRWEAAKYGEFRVGPDGKALLVGLADRDLKPIPIAP